MIPARNAASPVLNLAHILAKISLRGFAKTTNRKTSAIAEVNIIGIELKNLALRKTLIELGGHEDFLESCGSIRAS